ncbi:MAG: GH3 auxin-responsive promoter family protein [Muribaculaceae bacterium]|nr:GH3 auxin-responsive promoter family protein [Muribaculaceae bacterium]
MMNFTPIFRRALRTVVPLSEMTGESTRRLQERQWEWLVLNGRKTLFGEKHGISDIRTYDDFTRNVPVVEYPAIRDMVMRMVDGEKDILWPGATRRFAQSSGTSDGKSKYIPLTADSLSRCHYRGSSYVVAHYMNLYPQSRIFSGKGLILGGSYGNALHLKPGVKVGDLSAHLIDGINPVVNLFRVPSKKTALLENWEEKLPRLVSESMAADVTNLSGVPSWFLTVIKEVIRMAGCDTIHDVWPNLEVFFHGGISFGPYRREYERLTDSKRMRYLETYNASEGFFAVQTTRDPSEGMELLMDLGTFYEFVPLDELDDPHPRALRAWEVTPGEIYALAITSCNGLWRYLPGDTVKILSMYPLRIAIAGRTRHYINAFGEELMVFNADEAIKRATEKCGCHVANYTACPVFAEGGHRGRHQWLIEFSTPPADMDEFAAELDKALTEENSDYQAKRSGNIFLDPLSITVAQQGLFDDWLASTGKLGGQRKVPRLSNNRAIMDAMLKMNK